MSKITIQQMADRVSALMEERLKITGPSLEAKVQRAGRRLPREVREAAEALVAALQLAQNPKLLMQIDDEAVAIAYDICLRHLNGLNRAQRRRGMVLDAAARIAFALLVVGVLLVAVLRWRGFI
ncbi:hypothetical protein GC209_02235 [bacterium]|nr:hypothetical protein [bacterium]